MSAPVLYKQNPVVRLAPDAIVYINGQDEIQDNFGNSYKLRSFITDVNTDLSTESSPGSAGFSISIPNYKVADFLNKKDDSVYNKIFHMMDEVAIYFKGRFQAEGTTKDGAKVDKQYPYYHAFWGVVTSFVENYSDGSYNIQVSCADILRWWEITVVNINPSVVAAMRDQYKFMTSPDQYVAGGTVGAAIAFTAGLGGKETDRVKLTPFTTKFAGLNIAEILVELTKLNAGNLIPLGNSFDPLIGFESSGTINRKSTFSSAITQNEQLMDYWRKRFNQLGRRLRIFGIKGITPIGENVLKGSPNIAVTPPENPPENASNVDNSVKIEFNTENFLDVIPYTIAAGGPRDIDSELKSKLEIAKELKDSISFEFYMDVNGDIIFKPPFYNMNVIANDVSVIKDVDIISWSFNANESQIITRVDATGDFVKNIATEVAGKVLTATWIDYDAAKKYGLRATVRRFGWINNKRDLLTLAQAEMARINALARSGDITITGRPELRLGYPIYVPARDAFYYVQGIQHSFTFGSSFTTNLSVVAERRRVINDDGTINKWGIFRAVGDLKDSQQIIKGDPVSDDSTDNWLQNLYDVCVVKRNKLTTVKAANFSDESELLLSTINGTWNSFTNIQLPDSSNSLSEYQISDGDGYELVKPFKYGRGLNFRTSGEITKGDNEAAWTAQGIKPLDLELPIDPNNTAYILDDTNSMLTTTSSNPEDIASLAQFISPESIKRNING